MSEFEYGIEVDLTDGPDEELSGWYLMEKGFKHLHTARVVLRAYLYDSSPCRIVRRPLGGWEVVE